MIPTLMIGMNSLPLCLQNPEKLKNQTLVLELKMSPAAMIHERAGQREKALLKLACLALVLYWLPKIILTLLTNTNWLLLCLQKPEELQDLVYFEPLRLEAQVSPAVVVVVVLLLLLLRLVQRELDRTMRKQKLLVSCYPYRRRVGRRFVSGQTLRTKACLTRPPALVVCQ